MKNATMCFLHDIMIERGISFTVLDDATCRCNSTPKNTTVNPF